MSPVKSPVSSLPPLNGSLNVAKRRKVDGLSPSDHRRVYSAASPRGTDDVASSSSREAAISAGNLSPMASLVTPSKRSVSTPARLGTPRGGRRTPSLADRPIPVLMPKDEEDDVSRSRRSSYANLYVLEDTEDKMTGDKEGVLEKEAEATKATATEATKPPSTSNGKSIAESATDKGKEVDTQTGSVEAEQSLSSDKSFSESAPIESAESAEADVPKATLLPPPEYLEPPASPRKR